MLIKYYLNLHKKEMTLQDHLALDRTNLANERTFLSYTRTSFTFFVAGLSFIRFFSVDWIIVVGWIFIPISVLVFLRGLYVYKNREEIIVKAENGLSGNKNGSS